MLFNSYTFLLAFLPLTLLGFFAAARWSKSAGGAWLAACSLFFYGWWDYRYLGLLLGSICVNYAMGGYIARHAGFPSGRRVLVLGIAANLLALAYYKYADFFLSSANMVLATEFPLLHLVLPIGISFFTFTQIAFLADAQAGKVKEYHFVHYVLFVTYFPHLIAGPVLHHKEMMPQFDDDRNYSFSSRNMAVGCTIFALGLAKKVLLADNLAVHVAPVFAGSNAEPSLLAAWGATLAYTFQLYFDFSGYSDMAIGLSRMIGVQLPLNFNSPYKSVNISEFWRRWHMTLSRFLRDYLYIPLGGNRHGSLRRNVNLMTTMVLGGLWHGAGWTFVVWGALHGAYLVVNHAWAGLVQRAPLLRSSRGSRAVGVALTFLCVTIAWVYFRAPDLHTANQIVQGMLGRFDVDLPQSILVRLGPLEPLLRQIGVTAQLGGGAQFVENWSWVALGAAIAFLAPNSQEIVGRWFDRPAASVTTDVRPARSFSTRQAMAVGLLLALGLLSMSRPTEFLYFQF